MSAYDSLPVIIVSAVDAAAASVIISEIIDEGSGAGGVRRDGVAEQGAVWDLRNKYYTAAARLLPLGDGAPPPAGLDVQAHLIYLTEDEGADVSACSRRAAAAAAHVPRHGVRVVAARATLEAPALVAWASDARYEPVALLAPAPDPGTDVPETRGVARVREALHAHAWPGLRRAGAGASPAVTPHDSQESDLSSESSWGSWTGAEGAGVEEAGVEEEAGAVQRAAVFAEALALLPGVSARGDGGDDDATRRLHAEQLVAAFCRALGHDLRLDAPATPATPGEGEGEGRQ